ncbi:MAG: C-terminal binding protein [SAR202 cluster bacterium]|nr:C-terminal binding protein [SAR202 cluster bacterium]
MAKHKIACVVNSDVDFSLLEQQLTGLDYEMDVHICKSDGETIEAVRGADVIINQGVKMSREVIEEIDKAQAIVSNGHGFDRIDHDAATDQGVMLINSASVGTEEVSNHTIMMLLACAKDLGRLDKLVKDGGWTAESRAQIHSHVPIDGQTLGLVALGNIGRATARKAKVFGLQVIAYDPYLQPWTAREYRVELVPSLEELARRSDFVSMHVPLNDETREMVGESFFKAMKPTAYFVNTCRGPTVDERALIEALGSGEIAGAGIDVFEQEPTPADNPLLKLDNVILTPHTAGTSVRSRTIALAQLGQETTRVLRGTWPMSLVNPEVRAKMPARPLAVQY